MLSRCFPFIISYCILHHTRIPTALCLPSLCTALRPIKLPERIGIKELLDNYTSIRPPHDKLRISNKSRPTPPLFSPCSTFPLEKLTISLLIRQIPTFYGNGMFITAFTSARHLSLSWVRSTRSIPPHCTSWRSSLILSPHLRIGLPSVVFPFPPQNPVCTTPLPHMCYMPHPSHYSRFVHPITQITYTGL